MIINIDDLIKFISASLQAAGEVQGIEIDDNLAVMIFAADIKNTIVTSTFLGNQSYELNMMALVRAHLKDEDERNVRGKISLN